MSVNELSNDTAVANESSRVTTNTTSTENGTPQRINNADESRPQSTAPSEQSQLNTTTAESDQLADGKADDEGVNGDSLSASAAAPYSTRSRNRTSGARPNYAEDKDLDGDTEMNGTAPVESAPKKSTPAPTTTSTPNEEKMNASSVRRSGFAAVNNGAQSNNPHTAANGKEALPGTSTFTTHSAANQNSTTTSKKRKQPGSGVNTPAPSAPSHPAPRSRGAAIAAYAESNMMTFQRSGSYLKNGKLKADDGTALSINDHAYFVCEPPGEPYYLARIMQFLHQRNDPNAPIDAVRVNWYYRPKDIQRKVQDTRVVFASMHSDICPLTSLRGKCNILHISEVQDLDAYRKIRDSFWYEKLYDRYMHRYYEIIPTSKVINVPQHVKKVLDERWRFVLVEIGRGKELTSAVKTFLQKKPARGFAWACGPCSRAQERKLEARNTPNLGGVNHDVEEEFVDEEDEAPAEPTRASSVNSEKPQHPPATAEQIAQATMWPYRYLGIHCQVEDALDYDDRIYPRASSRLGPKHQANIMVWHGHPIEYVKTSDIKKKYIKTPSHKKDGKLSKETLALIEAEKDTKSKRPKWVLDEPNGYIHRGGDEPIEVKGKKEYTAQLIFKMPEPESLRDRGEDDNAMDIDPVDLEKLVDDYMEKVKALAPLYGFPAYSTNFMTKAIEKLNEHKFNVETALQSMKGLHLRSDLKEPDLNKEEIKRFEEGISKYGSELHSVARHVSPTIKEARIVRYYYMWKKTERGRQIWGRYEGRKSRKEGKKSDDVKKDVPVTKLLDDLADDQDDSAYDNGKAAEKKRGFECKFCSTRSSRQWRRAPGVAPGTLVPLDSASKNSKDKKNWLTLALCHRCAILWRKYGIQWESIEEVSKKVSTTGGRAWKKKLDEELIRALVEAQEEAGDAISSTTAAAAASMGVEVPASIVQSTEPSHKKTKGNKEPAPVAAEPVVEKKKVVAEKPPEPAPLAPEPPRVKILPCAICSLLDLPGDELLNCRDCRLAVHRSCYGVSAARSTKKWICDTCSNDRNPMVSTNYDCLLCPIRNTPHELMEPPKVSHKKKTDREREKERKEKEMVEEAVRLYRQQQELAGRPANPREALKRTSGNNWTHITCAIWNPEIKFGNAALLEPSEGFGLIPRERREQVCKLCNTAGPPCVPCHSSSCNVVFHVGCAHQAGYQFGFDLSPVKSTRRDVVSTIKLGEEIGSATAAIWCLHHSVQTIVHPITEKAEGDLTALQLFAQTFKQADLSVTGALRKALQCQQASTAQPSSNNVNRRVSMNTHQPSVDRVNAKGNRESPVEVAPKSTEEILAEPETTASLSNKTSNSIEKKCYNCQTDASPKWWSVEKRSRRTPSQVNGINSTSSVPNGVSHTDAPRSTPGPEAATGVLASGASESPSNAAVKTEPSAVKQTLSAVPTATPKEQYWQCHKCHVNKRSPPTSPEPVPVVPTVRPSMAFALSGLAYAAMAL
ncbi:putative phd finger and bah domain protein [Phaeomoniella chlamydospora]|uniref:Putative phd finger and bah domain protein n=1 Tax=Phaeomoniella chlamydospora TaxID=158046 RepID=A0A0G2E5X6_PHACM|nr:putative phd finger and bah domain protein [Phaeomoniella chlamydospora]